MLLNFKTKSEYDNIMGQLGNADYAFPSGDKANSSLAEAIFKPGIFIFINEDKKQVSYRGNFYGMPRFAAEELLEQAVAY